MPLSAATKAAHRAAKTAGIKQREAERRAAIQQHFQAERSHPILWLGPAEQKAAIRRLKEGQATAAAQQMSEQAAAVAVLEPAAAASPARFADANSKAPDSQSSQKSSRSSANKRKALAADLEQSEDIEPSKRPAQRSLLDAFATPAPQTPVRAAAAAYDEDDDLDLADPPDEEAKVSWVKAMESRILEERHTTAHARVYMCVDCISLTSFEK